MGLLRRAAARRDAWSHALALLDACWLAGQGRSGGSAVPSTTVPRCVRAVAANRKILSADLPVAYEDA